MDKSRIEILPRVWLDHRRGLYLEEHGLLAVADLHLGYAWAHRYRGQMLPLGGGDRIGERLGELLSCYQPRQLVLLGDLVHRAVPVSELVNDFQSLLEDLSRKCATKLIVGNHDRGLGKLAGVQPVELLPSHRAGAFLLLHGDRQAEPADAGERATLIMGHEHPVIALGDGVKAARFPCFLVSEQALVLPAFSLWSSGATVGSQPFMSELLKGIRFKKAVAICGGKLLPVSLN